MVVCRGWGGARLASAHARCGVWITRSEALFQYRARLGGCQPQFGRERSGNRRAPRASGGALRAQGARLGIDADAAGRARFQHRANHPGTRFGRRGLSLEASRQGFHSA
jgi:hypothetical protein